MSDNKIALKETDNDVGRGQVVDGLASHVEPKRAAEGGKYTATESQLKHSGVPHKI